MTARCRDSDPSCHRARSATSSRRRRLRADRPAEGRRAARRRGHRPAPGRARLQRGRGIARRVGLCGRRRPVLPREHRRMPRLESAGRRRDAALTGRSYYAGIAQDTIAMAVNDLITVGATPLVVQAYWAAGGSEWFADAQRAQALVEGWKARLRRLRRRLGRRRDAGAGRHRRRRPHRPRRQLHRPRQPEAAAVARRPAGARRRDRAARVERHPRQRPEPGAQAGRAPAGRLPDAGRRAGPDLRRRAARADDALFAGDRGAVPAPASRRTTAPTSPATAGASCCAIRRRSPTGSTPLPPVPPVLRFIQQHAGQDDHEAYGTLQHGRRLRAVRRRRRRRSGPSRSRAGSASSACVGGARRSRTQAAC